MTQKHFLPPPVKPFSAAGLKEALTRTRACPPLPSSLSLSLLPSQGPGHETADPLPHSFQSFLTFHRCRPRRARPSSPILQIGKLNPERIVIHPNTTVGIGDS